MLACRDSSSASLFVPTATSVPVSGLSHKILGATQRQHRRASPSSLRSAFKLVLQRKAARVACGEHCWNGSLDSSAVGFHLQESSGIRQQGKDSRQRPTSPRSMKSSDRAFVRPMPRGHRIALLSVLTSTGLGLSHDLLRPSSSWEKPTCGSDRARSHSLPGTRATPVGLQDRPIGLGLCSPSKNNSRSYCTESPEVAPPSQTCVCCFEGAPTRRVAPRTEVAWEPLVVQFVGRLGRSLCPPEAGLSREEPVLSETFSNSTRARTRLPSSSGPDPLVTRPRTGQTDRRWRSLDQRRSRCDR